MASPDYEMWKNFTKAKYLVSNHCLDCKIKRACNNYYCLKCKIGGLCPSTFKPEEVHHGHPWVQVRRQTGQNAVAAEDLEKLIGTSSVRHIYQCSLNGKELCYLECVKDKKEASRQKGSHSVLRECKACKYVMPKQIPKEMDGLFVVCSVECLVFIANDHPDWNLLLIKDGAMTPTHGPKTAVEKFGGSTTLVQAAAPSSVLVGRGRKRRLELPPFETSDDHVNYSEFEVGYEYDDVLKFLAAAFM